jgi:hypothetical protein
MIETLLEDYRLALERVNTLKDQLQQYSDGNIYVTCLRCYGSLTYEAHTNEFTVQELCDEYYGDNGIVDVYTDKSSHGINTYGTVHVMTLEEIQSMSKKNISMSRAVINWFAP